MSHHAKATARKTNRASHSPRVSAKERAKKVTDMKYPEAKFKESTSAKASYKGKRSKGGFSGLEKPNHRLTKDSVQRYSHENSHTDHSWFADGWSFDCWE